MISRRRSFQTSLILAMALLRPGLGSADAPATIVDIATLSTSGGELLRVYGSLDNFGNLGLPIAGGFDCDADGFPDMAMGAFRANSQAGRVHLVFGTGVIAGAIDTAGLPSSAPAERLKIVGTQVNETAGSEVWMDDVTGDGLGDLLIARQNFTPSGGPIGAGALTILVGGAEVRAFANTLQLLDLAAPPPSLTITTIVGAAFQDRVGIWMRTGDVTGDGIADIALGADQASISTDTHRGEVYVIRGGPHLAATQTVDLADFRSPGDGTILVGNIAVVTPPAFSHEYHFGATVQVADLDGNDRAEVIAAAALYRSGASVGPVGGFGWHPTGGTTHGTVYIAWDDNFPAGVWPAGYEVPLESPPGTRTSLAGPSVYISFGEELIGGDDYDADGEADLFVGDLVASANGFVQAGRGLVLYDIASLKGLDVDLNAPPMGLVTTEFLGGAAGDIAADTAMQGDFDGDGFDDLAFSSPHASPLGRGDAGTIHVFHGQQGVWPTTVSLVPGALPPENLIRVSEIYGAKAGDVLCYSGAAGDMNGDGRTDFITNEMLGDGLDPAAFNVGNLIVLSGTLVPEPTRVGLALAALLSLALLRRGRATRNPSNSADRRARCTRA